MTRAVSHVAMKPIIRHSNQHQEIPRRDKTPVIPLFHKFSKTLLKVDEEDNF